MFRGPAALRSLYPGLLQQAMTTFGSSEVMRFLGYKTTASGTINGHFQGEVVSDLKTRPEGVRVKHRVGSNSIKMYDKQGSVLRVETTIILRAERNEAFRRTDILVRPCKKLGERRTRTSVVRLHLARVRYNSSA